MTYFRHLQYVILNCCQATSALAKGVFCTRRTNRVHMRTCPGYLSRLQRTLMTYGPQNDSIVWICLGYRQLCFKEKGKQRGADLRKTVHNPSHAVQQKTSDTGGETVLIEARYHIQNRVGEWSSRIQTQAKYSATPYWVQSCSMVSSIEKLCHHHVWCLPNILKNSTLRANHVTAFEYVSLKIIC